MSTADQDWTAAKIIALENLKQGDAFRPDPDTSERYYDFMDEYNLRMERQAAEAQHARTGSRAHWGNLQRVKERHEEALHRIFIKYHNCQCAQCSSESLGVLREELLRLEALMKHGQGAEAKLSLSSLFSRGRVLARRRITFDLRHNRKVPLNPSPVISISSHK